MDYARIYLEKFKHLGFVQEQHLRYLDSENVDTMFLLRRVGEV